MARSNPSSLSLTLAALLAPFAFVAACGMQGDAELSAGGEHDDGSGVGGSFGGGSNAGGGEIPTGGTGPGGGTFNFSELCGVGPCLPGGMDDQCASGSGGAGSGGAGSGGAGQARVAQARVALARVAARRRCSASSFRPTTQRLPRAPRRVKSRRRVPVRPLPTALRALAACCPMGRRAAGCAARTAVAISSSVLRTRIACPTR